MDGNIKILMDATGTTETEARSAIDEARGDVSRALDLLGANAKDVMVMNLRFDTTEGEKYTGFATLIFEIDSGNTMFLDLVFPLDQQSAKRLDVSMPPIIFSSTMKNIKNKLSDRKKADCKGQTVLFKSKLTQNVVLGIISCHEKGQSETVNEQFEKIIQGIIGIAVQVKCFGRAHGLGAVMPIIGPDAEESASIATAERKASESFSSKPQPAQYDRPEDIPEGKPEGDIPRIVLVCEPEISPAYGRPARDLAAPEEIVVTIKDSRESARYFASLLGGLVEEELIPMVVPLVKLERLSDNLIEAYVEFGPGVYGHFFIPPDVKLKTKDEVEIYDPFEDEESLFASDRAGRIISYELVVLFASLIILIVVLLRL